MEKNFKNKLFYILMSFFIPFLIISCYSAIKYDSFYDLYVSDLGEQYISMFDYLLEFFKGNKNFIYSFSNGLGNSMYGTFFYYLSSPLNIFLIFANSNNVHIFVIILIFIKIGLCGLTMHLYLLKNKKLHCIYRLIFSTSYALMSFNIIYYFCTMWLDVIYFAPLILMGLDKILENKKSKFYIIFLFLSIFSNYYMSYILCLFLILYFSYRILTKYNLKKDYKIIKQITIKFIIHSLLAGLLASFMILPLIDEIKNIYRDYDTYNYSLLLTEKISYIISPIGIASNAEQYRKPYIHCGFFVSLILLIYIFYEKDKNKKYFLFLIIYFILLIFINQLTYIWHGFSYPILLSYRFSPFFSLIMIVVASEKINNIKKLKMTYFEMLKFSLVYLLLNIISGGISVNYGYEFDFGLYLINFFFMLFNFVLISINMQYNNIYYKIAILVLLIIEIIIQFKILLPSSNYKIDKLYNRYKFYNIATFSNPNFRISGSPMINLTENLPTSVGSINSFTSINNLKIKNFLLNSGYYVSSTSSLYDNDNIFMNKALGVKYLYGDIRNEYYMKKNKNILYQVDSYISLGYTISGNDTIIDDTNVFTYQNSFSQLVYSKDIFKECKVNKIGHNVYEIENCDGDVYIWYDSNVGSSIIRNGEIIYNNEIKKINITDNKTIISDNIINIYVAKMNNDVYKSIPDAQLNVTKIFKNILYGTIKIKENNRTMMLTIPYTDNFDIYIDNKKVNYYEIFNTFIAVNLTSGKHSIKVIYKVKYLKIGILLSCIGIILTFIYINFYKFSIKRQRNINIKI